jgi:hypothetical protein
LIELAKVHLIEYSDLVGLKADGTSNPGAYIEVMGQTKKSSIAKKQTSCFINEVFYFNFKDLTSEMLSQGHVRIAVYDHFFTWRSDLIGIYSVRT